MTRMTHISESFDTDLEGWWHVSCQCGWAIAPLPDTETAIDVLMEHAYEAGFIDGTHQDHPPEPGTQP